MTKVKYCLFVIDPSDLSIVTKNGKLIEWELEEGKDKGYQIMSELLPGKLILVVHKFLEKDNVTYLPFKYFSLNGKWRLPDGYSWTKWHELNFGEF